ncbi:MAG TPA: site-2 protease family protein [Terriglobia bacterium]|nr:site-2 protease family protein [Terriglobia bacterium]
MGDSRFDSSLGRSILIGSETPAPPRRLGWRWRPAWRPRLPAWTASLPFHLLLFALTALSTVTVGAEIALNTSRRLPAFDLDLSLALLRDLWHHPLRLALGVPFSCTLLGILLAHELGHYLTCRYYGLRVSYPYFIPAPTLIGTLGAFIKIRSPIFNRCMLFDVAVAGPLAGFVLAVPALAYSVLHSHLRVGSFPPGAITPGIPLLQSLLTHLLRPGVSPSQVALSPAGCAAWVGMFATALNLLPMSQLDGGHILYATLGKRHRMLSRVFWLALLPLGYFSWPGWFVWAAMIGVIGIGHPPVLMPSDRLGRVRQSLACGAAVIFALTFMPTPFSVR